ncbi:MAG: polysaccharide deacetylase family protein [Deltaproteobacteria bacterium]|nr:polysaccharide deacetylase family protein [Deltaproteobacteria bacterium]
MLVVLALSACAPAARSRAGAAARSRAAPPVPAQHGPAATAASQRVLALTIDDLPFVGGVAAGDDLEAATGRILAAVRGVPATGFVACGRAPERLAILRRWRDEGVELGNHTTSHRAIDDVSIDHWMADARACGDAVASATGKAPTRFRFPFLRTGATPALRDDAARRIAALGWTAAPVTIDTSDWVLDVAYVAALGHGDRARAAEIREALVAHVAEASGRYDAIARARLGHAVPQVLLLHANALLADALPAVLSRLRADGWSFATLADVLAEPVYRAPDRYSGPIGLSWLYRATTADAASDWAWDAGRARAMAERFGVAREGLSADRGLAIDRDLRARLLGTRAIVVTHERPAAANSLVVELDDGALLVASSPMTEAATDRLLDWLGARFGPRRIVAVETHFHWDGAAGSNALRRRGAEVWASETTASLARDRQGAMRVELVEAAGDPVLAAELRDTRIAEPTATFRDRQTLRFGADEVELLFPGAAHSPDNVVVWFARDRILFGGCMIRGGDSLGYLGDADVPSWAAALDRLDRFDPAFVVPGHGDRFDPGLVAATRALVREALRQAR